VLEKAGYEVLDLEVDAAALVGSGVGVAESNPALLEAFDSVVGDGNAVDVAREVESRVLAVADLLDVDHPWFGFGPEVGIGFLFEASTFEGVCDLGAKNLGDGVSWEEKVRVGWLNPGIPVEGEGAGGDEDVDMGVVGECAGPGVKDGENRDATADPSGIGRKGLDASCSLTE